MIFTENVQLAVTWRIIANILLFHGSEQNIHIEQNYGDTTEYSFALTEGVLGLPYLDFCPSEQLVKVEVDIAEHSSDFLTRPTLMSNLSWPDGDYVTAFLSRDPQSVVRDIEELAGFVRNEYEACWITQSTLPVTLMAGLLQRNMFFSRKLSITNAFCYSKDDENCKVWDWARSDPSIPTWAFESDEEWVEKAKYSSHLWRVGTSYSQRDLDNGTTTGLLFNLNNAFAWTQDSYENHFSLWKMYEEGIGYQASLDRLEALINKNG